MSHPSEPWLYRLGLRLLKLLEPRGVNCAQFALSFDTGESTPDDLQLVMRIRAHPTDTQAILSLVVDVDYLAHVVDGFRAAKGDQQRSPIATPDGDKHILVLMVEHEDGSGSGRAYPATPDQHHNLAEALGDPAVSMHVPADLMREFMPMAERAVTVTGSDEL